VNRCRFLSEALRKEFCSLYRILPSHILAYILRNGPVSIDEAVRAVPDVVELLKKNNRNISFVEKFDAQEIISKGIELLKRNRIVSVKKDTINILKINIIRYYSASVEVGG